MSEASCLVCGNLLREDGRCWVPSDGARDRHLVAALESIAASLAKLASPEP
jgi:hypothetical protein